MALTREDIRDKTTALTVHVHAPENLGFTHTIGSRFTYFEGSKSGTRETFGLSAHELNKIFQTFKMKFIADESKYKDTVSSIKSLFEILHLSADEIKLIADKQKAKSLCNDPSEMVSVVIESGHIPLIMSKCTAAAQYNRATRNLGTEDLKKYFDFTLGAKTQAIEYVAKIKMMSIVAKLYTDVSCLRFKYNSGTLDFVACTRLLHGLHESVIKVNQASMPKEYVQFDLAKTFTDNIFKIICRMNPLLVGKTFIEDLMHAVSVPQRLCYNRERTIDTQAIVSKLLYQRLESFFEEHGLKKDAIEIDDELDAILQEVLPLAAYLNSEFNPFARNGIFGKVSSSEFHKEALEAYRQHETACAGDYKIEDKYVYQYHETTRTEEYDGDQMDRIINGANDEVKPTAIAARGLFARLTAGSAVSSETNSDSAARREQLALPAPAIYTQLYLTHAKEEEEKDNLKRPGKK